MSCDRMVADVDMFRFPLGRNGGKSGQAPQSRAALNESSSFPGSRGRARWRDRYSGQPKAGRDSMSCSSDVAVDPVFYAFDLFWLDAATPLPIQSNHPSCCTPTTSSGTVEFFRLQCEREPERNRRQAEARAREGWFNSAIRDICSTRGGGNCSRTLVPQRSNPSGLYRLED
jgi:hypothetical protein